MLLILILRRFSLIASYIKNSSGGGSSGSSAVVDYPVTVEDTANGSVTVSPESASAGTKVTVTPDPEKDYETDTIAVKDENGDAVEVIDNHDGTFSFIMPYGGASVKAVFKEITLEDDHEAVCPSKAFRDLDTTQWYHEAIDYVLLNNYFDGVSSDIFDPNGTMTRAMFVTVLGRIAGISSSQNAESSFSDVPAGRWYTVYVDWAAGNGIVLGYDREHFGPDDPITREQMATILYRYAKYAGIIITPADGNRIQLFVDANQVSGYAKEAMSLAVGNSLINGTGSGKLEPQKTATRAQVAQILMNHNQTE